MFFIHDKLTSTVRPWEIKKWPDTTMVRTRGPDSSFDSNTFKKTDKGKSGPASTESTIPISSVK